MRNRVTAKRTNMRWIKKDKDGKPEPEPSSPRLLEHRAKHMEEHPSDIISFLVGEEREAMKDLLSLDERNVHWVHKKYKRIPPKRIEQILRYLENNDTKKLYACSGHHLRSIAMDWLEMFRRKSGIKKPEMPLDDKGEVIPYPKGGGRGKIAVVEWLCKYEDRYRTLKKEEDLTHSINQTLLDGS